MKSQKEIIKKLWRKSFVSNKRRNYFVILAIALTTLLITSVISLGSSFIESNEKQIIQYVGTTADASVNNLTDEQYEKIKKVDSIAYLGQQCTVANVSFESVEIKKTQVLLHWFSENEWLDLRKPTITDFKGTYPKQKNEILASLFSLKVLGITNPEIGMEISIKYTINDESYFETFILSGYYTEYVSQRSSDFSYVLVSTEFMSQYENDITNVFTSFKYKSSNNISLQNEQLSETLQLSEDQEIASTLRESTQNTTTIILGLCLFLCIILVSGGLLIYNVLYISIANDIRFFGLLKAVGAIKKQLKKIVLKQALLLAIIGIPIGLLVGTMISLLIIPLVLKATTYSKASVVSIHPFIYIGASLFSFVMTVLSSVKPANFAAKVPLVQAVHFTEAKSKKKFVRSKNGGKLPTFAWRNIFRDKKRALVVIISLFLGITSFVAVNTTIQSIDFEKFVLSEMDYDVTIENSNRYANENQSEIKQVGSQLSNIVTNQSGIKDLLFSYRIFIQIPYESEKYADYISSYNKYFKYAQIDEEIMTNDNFIGEVRSLTSNELDTLIEKMDHSIDKTAFERGEFALVQTDEPKDFEQLTTIEFIDIETSQTYQFSIGGFVPNDYLEIQTQAAPVLFVSESYMKDLFTNAEVASIQFNVEEDSEEMIINNIEEILNQQLSYKMTTKSEMKEKAKSETVVLRLLGNTLALILILIGLLNFVNIMTTSILSRKQELATMESIGMTPKQMNRMLMLEGSYYTAIVAFLVLTIGLAITYGFFLVIQQTASYAVFSLPIIQILISLLLIFIIGVLVPRFVMKSVSKGALAVRIKE